VVAMNCAVAAATTIKRGNFGKQRELASFEPVIVAERQRDEPGQEGEAPHPCQRTPILRGPPGPRTKRGHQIIAFADEQVEKAPKMTR